MLFMFDYGIVCCDFFGGDVCMLYCLIVCVFVLLFDMCLYLCYDYQLGGCDVQFVMIVVEQCCVNVYVKDGVSEDDFVVMCIVCDVMFDMFVLMLLLVQVNMCVGYLFEFENNGVCYLKILFDVI